MNLMGEINYKTNVWDLHIHTCRCTKASAEFRSLTVREYVDNLINIYSKYSNLKMISFTDHNNISQEVYDEFHNRKTNITLIPGVELDVKFSDTHPRKHLIIYFDDSYTSFNDIASKVNGLIQKHNISDKNPISFYSLMTDLIDLKLRFLLSPHAFKQRQRGINTEWLGEETNYQSN